MNFLKLLLEILPYKQILKFLIKQKAFFLITGIAIFNIFCGITVMLWFQVAELRNELRNEILNNDFQTILFKNTIVDPKLKSIVEECGNKSYARFYFFGQKKKSDNAQYVDNAQYAILMSAFKCEGAKCEATDNTYDYITKPVSLDSDTLFFLQSDQIYLSKYGYIDFNENNVLTLNLIKDNKSTALALSIQNDYYRIYKIIKEQQRVTSSTILIKKKLDKNNNIKYLLTLAFLPDSEINCSIKNGNSPESLINELFAKIR